MGCGTGACLDLGIVGLGYWGPNLLKGLSRIPQVSLKYAYDTDKDKWAKLASVFPETRFAENFELLIADEDLDAVVIATPAPTHAALAQQALLANKDVFVEKPLALSTVDAEELVKLAADRNRVLMVGHLLEYHPAVIRLKEIIDAGELGEIFYVYTHRLNLGIIRRNENALWSLGPHDLSIILRLLDQEPVEVQASGQGYLEEAVEDVVFGTLRFTGGRIAHLHMSWFDPQKERKITIVGSEKMAVFDDTSKDEKLKLYDKGVQKPEHETYYEYGSLRFGGTVSPDLSDVEPLKLECEHFVECLLERKRPISDGHSGLRVVRVLDALQRSMNAGGQPMLLGEAVH
jgi:predicted dehydrogenase